MLKPGDRLRFRAEKEGLAIDPAGKLAGTVASITGPTALIVMEAGGSVIGVPASIDAHVDDKPQAEETHAPRGK